VSGAKGKEFKTDDDVKLFTIYRCKQCEQYIAIQCHCMCPQSVMDSLEEWCETLFRDEMITMWEDSEKNELCVDENCLDLNDI